MNTKHTPGPWFVGEQMPAPSKSIHAFIGIGNGACHVGLASITPLTGFCEAEANARLIAAAPELLEACKEVVFLIEGIAGLDDQQIQAINQARAAIAKAEGEGK